MNQKEVINSDAHKDNFKLLFIKNVKDSTRQKFPKNQRLKKLNWQKYEEIKLRKCLSFLLLCVRFQVIQ